ncbi:RagB/SusD family nutrient uptake outer membrane protein [Mucilaginibacter sp.]|uniref:RagB/SusD family nutrient uptake outer membrane protein n=1 Tax=Mucilaginibacter sp. TaxID=1882438 RepID=UPI00284A244C|nr:RagB/SusD family nutrient uptake outer membrane protein [Mucilaginibacter sp.]MDR3697200.1 RagB/SusD family nutrient uptake outer membrane protein [Mucilaginibacter sp.]
MKKLIHISFFSLIAAFVITLNSCVKLKQISPTAVQASQLFKDSTGLSSALVGLYSTLEVQDYYGANYPMMCDLNSDNGVAGGYNNTSLNEFGSYNVTSSNIFIQNTYVAIYKTVATANAILAGESTVTGASQQYLNSVKGQALALRAMAHFDLLRAFGYHWDLTSPFGIPVVTTVQTSTGIVPRSTVAATYAAIISDLQQAATLLKSNTGRNPNYVNPAIVNALLARVYLYEKDYTNAAKYATLVINDGAYTVLDKNNFTNIYTSHNSKESIFELPFNQQNQSEYNATTYARPDAASTEVLFILNPNLQAFFQSRPGDLRYNLVDTLNPNGYLRTLKYASDIKQKDNSALVIRISEMYLIRAEALGRSSGLADVNMIRTNRGLAALTGADVPDDVTYAQVVADENRAEFNFEGHRYFDLARTGQVVNVLTPLTSLTVTIANSCYPIPLREISATGGTVVQNPGY